MRVLIKVKISSCSLSYQSLLYYNIHKRPLWLEGNTLALVFLVFEGTIQTAVKEKCSKSQNCVITSKFSKLNGIKLLIFLKIWKNQEKGKVISFLKRGSLFNLERNFRRYTGLFTMGSLRNKLSKLNLGIIYIIKLINLGLNELM